MSHSGFASRLEKGQSMVEFAFGMVMVLILLAGAVDFGRALFTFMALRDAAQEGALFGSFNPDDDTAIINRVCNASSYLGGLSCGTASSNTIQVEKTLTSTACVGNGITIRVTYQNFPITMPFLGTLVGAQSFPIKATINDTILSADC